MRVDKFCQSAGVPDNFIHRGIPGGGRSHRRQNMSLIPRSGRGRGGWWSLSGACTQPHPALTLCPIVCPGPLGPGGGEYVSDFPLGGPATFLSIMSQKSCLKRVLFG